MNLMISISMNKEYNMKEQEIISFNSKNGEVQLNAD